MRPAPSPASAAPRPISRASAPTQMSRSTRSPAKRARPPGGSADTVGAELSHVAQDGDLARAAGCSKSSCEAARRGERARVVGVVDEHGARRKAARFPPTSGTENAGAAPRDVRRVNPHASAIAAAQRKFEIWWRPVSGRRTRGGLRRPSKARSAPRPGSGASTPSAETSAPAGSERDLLSVEILRPASQPLVVRVEDERAFRAPGRRRSPISRRRSRRPTENSAGARRRRS